MTYPADAGARSNAPKQPSMTVRAEGDTTRSPARGPRSSRPPEWEERDADAGAGVKIALAFLLPLLGLMVWAFAGG